MQQDSDTADSGKSLILCEKKHQEISNSASTSLKNPLFEWDYDQRAGMNNLKKTLMQAFFHTLQTLGLSEYVYAALWEYGNTSSSLRFGFDFLVSTNCKAIYLLWRDS